MTNMNVYTEASATKQTLFDETRSYRRVSTAFFLPSIIAPPLKTTLYSLLVCSTNLLSVMLISQMLNERGYERETNCSVMLKTSSRLLRAQRVHRASRKCVHANELAAAWPDPLTLI